MHSLSRTTWFRKGVVMVLDSAKPKNRKSTKKPGMRGRDAARKLTLKVDILQEFTIDFSEIHIIVNHNLQSDGQNKIAKRWTKLQKETTRTISLQRNSKDTKDNGILHWSKQAKIGLWNFDLIFEPLSWWKVVFPTSQNKLQNSFLHHNLGNGIRPQAHHGGTSLNGIGGAHKIFF